MLLHSHWDSIALRQPRKDTEMPGDYFPCSQTTELFTSPEYQDGTRSNFLFLFSVALLHSICLKFEVTTAFVLPVLRRRLGYGPKLHDDCFGQQSVSYTA